MTVAKGQSYPDGTYIYTCGNCNGTGYVEAGHCTHCYGGDVEQVIIEMRKGARGQRYYGLLKTFLKHQGKTLVYEFDVIQQREGKVTVFDVGYISLKTGLNLKATFEWLAEVGRGRSGIYGHLMDSTNPATGKKWRVQDIYDAVYEKHPELKAESETP